MILYVIGIILGLIILIADIYWMTISYPSYKYPPPYNINPSTSGYGAGSGYGTASYGTGSGYGMGSYAPIVLGSIILIADIIWIGIEIYGLIAASESKTAKIETEEKCSPKVCKKKKEKKYECQTEEE